MVNDESTTEKTVKVAVVGSGLAGLTASYLLAQPTKGQKNTKIEVHLFEKTANIGMDCASIALPLPGAKQKAWVIDVPMRSFQGGYYRNLIALYKRLGASFLPSDFTYSFSFLAPPHPDDMHGRPTVTATALYNGANGTKGVSKPAILNNPPVGESIWSIPLLRCLWGTGLFLVLAVHLGICYALLLWHALPYWRPRRVADQTLGDWVDEVAPRGRLARVLRVDVAWEDFVHTMLVPLMSAVCTAAEEDVFDHPIEELLDYVWLGLGQSHYVLANGVREVVARMSFGMENIHLGCPIIALRPDASNPRLLSIDCLTSDGTPSSYDGFEHIVFATQANKAVPVLRSYANALPDDCAAQRDAVEAQIQCLKTFKYCQTIVVNHTDDSLLPAEIQDRRDLNFVSSSWDEDEDYDSQICVPSSFTMATHILPRPAGLDSALPNVYQTTNPVIAPRQDTILSVSSLERAVLTRESKYAVRDLCRPKSRRLGECPTEVECELGVLQGGGRRESKDVPGIWLCGSYAYLGVPLLEGCVVSARNVVEQGILKSEGLKLAEAPWCT